MLADIQITAKVSSASSYDSERVGSFADLMATSLIRNPYHLSRWLSHYGWKTDWRSRDLV